jgi:hypothetical protein
MPSSPTRPGQAITALCYLVVLLILCDNHLAEEAANSTASGYVREWYFMWAFQS